MYNLRQIQDNLWQTIQPAIWIANFKDGSTETSKTHEAFYDIPIEKRNEIISLQLKIDDNRFIINRKDKNGDIIKGFFYHIKEGRFTFMGAYDGADLSFFAERIGFCYNSNGDSVVIRTDHSKLVDKIGKKMRKIEDLIDTSDDKQIDKLINDPMKYSIQSDFFSENIVEKRINIALFGKLEELEEMATPPRTYMNNEEIAIVNNV